jgi:predicted phosphodiesterase
MPSWLPTFGARGPRAVGRPLLALSDVHGDLAALEAVLDAVADVELCGILCAGDHCLGGPEPFETWQRLHELGATLLRGTTDLALATDAYQRWDPSSAEQEALLQSFVDTRAALGEIVCRRLGELPTTAVVSLDDTTGVMGLHGSPSDENRGLTDKLSAEVLAVETACVAEDVLVTGFTHRAFVRRTGPLLVVNAGSVGQSPVEHAGARTAHAVLVQGYSDGIVRAKGKNILVPPVEAAIRSAG